MKWWPEPCSPGDVVRIPLGNIYHYGIFVSEDEVIQYGLPPLPAYRDRPEARQVVATSVDVFSCGKILEVGRAEKGEKKRRASPEATVAAARARLGEAEYDLIHNNCEHFVFECAFGEKRSAQEEDARRRWNSRPVLDVYLAPVPAGPEPADIASPQVMREIARTRDPERRRSRRCAWRVLEYAADRSLGLDAEKLTFRKDRLGRWSCGAMEFSLAHTEGAVAVAVSSAPVGVDIENIPAFVRRYGGNPGPLLRKIAAGDELAGTEGREGEALLRLLTEKQSLFKSGHTGRFRPARLHPGEETRLFVTDIPLRVCVAVSGGQIGGLRVYRYDGETARRVMGERLESGGDILCKYFCC